MKIIFKYIIALVLVLFTGCQNDAPKRTTNYQQQPQDQSPLSQLEPIYASPSSSFAEDILFYEIAGLEEGTNPSEEGGAPTQSKSRKANQRDSEDDTDDDTDDEDEGEDGGDEDGDGDTDENDGRDKSDNNKDGDDDDSDDSDDDDDGDGDGDESDDDTESDDGDDTKTVIVTRPVPIDFESLGSSKIGLNGKDYTFDIAQDNYGNRIQTPSFTQNADGTYTVSIQAYVIEEGGVVFEDGIFTLSFILPSLNESSMILMTASSNILTNSATAPVYATVAVSKDSGKIQMTIISDKFDVQNRYHTRTFPANFTLGFALDVSF